MKAILLRDAHVLSLESLLDGGDVHLREDGKAVFHLKRAWKGNVHQLPPSPCAKRLVTAGARSG